MYIYWGRILKEYSFCHIQEGKKRGKGGKNRKFNFFKSMFLRREREIPNFSKENHFELKISTASLQNLHRKTCSFLLDRLGQEWVIQRNRVTWLHFPGSVLSGLCREPLNCFCKMWNSGSLWTFPLEFCLMRMNGYEVSKASEGRPFPRDINRDTIELFRRKNASDQSIT